MRSLVKTAKKRAMIFYVVFGVTIGMFLFAGIRGSVVARNYIDKLERNNLEVLVSTSATQINPTYIKALSGNESDLFKPEYLYLKNQLREMKSANKDARFVYLFGLKGEKIIFLVDSEDVGDEGYSAPGEVYYEYSDKELAGFERGSTSYTEGPLEDRWGTWVSGLAPILDESGEVIAQIGFDVDAKVWVNNAVYVETLIAAISFIVVLFLIILFLGARRLLVALDREQISYELVAKEEANLVSLIENTTDAIWSCDLMGRTIESNTSAKKFFKEWYHFDLLSGVETSHISYNENSLFRQEYDRAKRGEKFIVEFSKKVSNAERWVECAFNPIVSISKEVIGVTVFARDISDRKQVEKFRQELIGFASHELRTPLTSIKWFAELLLSDKDYVLPQKQKGTIENMYRTTEQTLRLVKNFLESSKIDRNGGLVVLARKNDISYLIKDILRAESVFFEKKKVSYELGSFFDAPHIFMFDEEKIRYVLQNLINNGIKYSKDGGRIIILGEQNGDSINITIQDFGIGIPKEDQSKIFERAYRATNALSEGIEGNGLGLYLVKAIATAHNGNISFNSVAGEGSVFTVELPFVTESNKSLI